MGRITGTMSVVVISDLDAAVKFYRDTLGLELAGLYPEFKFAVFTLSGGATLGMHPPMAYGAGKPLERGRNTGVILSVGDIQATYEEWRQKGVKFLHEPKQMPWGEVMTKFEDPDGNEFALLQPVKQ
ncbi:MAG: VOC family protein [Deltaproteobacteria bacterium]|nr:VOC family protein [Deltaproteobacteria bacterium]MBI3077250.1 VOC family protein [Deltaproteobacteria bacterium]